RDLALALRAMEGSSGRSPAPRAEGRGGAAGAVLQPVHYAALALVMAVCALLGYAVGARTPRAVPTFHRLTWRRGFVGSARITADGGTVVYSAAWEGRGLELFSTRPEASESRALAFGPAELLALSPAGELALALRPELGSWIVHTGTLARASLAGGAAREPLAGGGYADW